MPEPTEVAEVEALLAKVSNGAMDAFTALSDVSEIAENPNDETLPLLEARALLGQAFRFARTRNGRSKLLRRCSKTFSSRSGSRRRRSSTTNGWRGLPTMPRGAAVIPYNGKRGTVWRVKYHDGERQVMETLGREADGWTRRKAERALGAKVAEVERGMRKPRRRTFADLLDEFEAVALTARPRKKSTLIDYRSTIRNHLRPSFGTDDLGALSQRPEAFERYASRKLGEGLSAKTVRNHLVLLG